MGILINLLSDTNIEKIDVRQSLKVPHSIERSMERVENYALYKYAFQKAQRYPRYWIANQLKTKVLIKMSIINNHINIKDINILSKSDALSEEDITNEVYKTAYLARKDIPQTNKNVNISIQLNWI